ncbi:MAG: WYL domain-containing protein [Chloroflexi bacterium]|nr:WYL domain-containing protein [Chloroflexota bacterium]
MNKLHVNPPAHFNPHQPLTETIFAVFDTETTGLSPAYGHRICEVGCLRVRNGTELDRFESLVDPRRPVSPGAFRVNRITADMLHGAPVFDQIAGPLLQVIEGAVLVAHNAPFDLGFLAAELGNARLPVPDNPVVDTLALTRRTYSLPRNGLSAVVAALGVTVRPTHRALSDVQATSGVLERIIKDLERRQGITTLGQLIEFQGGPVPYPHARTLSLPPAITEALENGGRVRMRYMDAKGRETDRLVRPMRVRARGGALYLIAHCYHRDEIRTFRLDRVVEMALEE